MSYLIYNLLTGIVVANTSNQVILFENKNEASLNCGKNEIALLSDKVVIQNPTTSLYH